MFHNKNKIAKIMPSILTSIGVTIAASYVFLDRSQVAVLAQTLGYGLGRSVGMLRNYRQNAEKLVKATPDGQKGVMTTMRELDTVAREIRMAVWMARPGAMMRMGPMGTMGMTLTPPANQTTSQMGQQPTGVTSMPQSYLAPGQMIPPAMMMQQSSFPQQTMNANDMQAISSMAPSNHSEVFDGGSDILVSSWRNGIERTRVVKKPR